MPGGCARTEALHEDVDGADERGHVRAVHLAVRRQQVAQRHGVLHRVRRPQGLQRHALRVRLPWGVAGQLSLDGAIGVVHAHASLSCEGVRATTVF